MGQLVTGWGLDTGFQNATLTEGSAGSFSTTTPTGNAGARAILPSVYGFANVGDSILLTGSVSFVNTLGNQQFRFGLFNNNGNALGTLAGGLWTGATTAGWLGYLVEPGNAGGSTALYGRNGTGANAWLSTSGAAYNINQNPTTVSMAPGTYAFSLALTRDSATSVSIQYSVIGSAFNSSGTYEDIGGLSSGITSFDTVGFLLNGSTGAGTFTGVSVSLVPEPSTFALAGLGLSAIAGFARRRKV